MGTSALKVARDIPERMEIVGLAANRSVEALVAQVAETGVKLVAVHKMSKAVNSVAFMGLTLSCKAAHYQYRFDRHIQICIAVHTDTGHREQPC